MQEDQFDQASLQTYLTQHVSQIGQIQSLDKFSDGQSNPTYLLETSSGQFVLRRQPPGELLKSAHAVDREFRVIDALQNSEVPVARAIHLCQQRDVIGSMFYLMSYQPGRIFWDPTLPGLDPAQRGEIYSEMNRVLAALHDIDIEAVGLSDFGRPGSYFERQVSRWSGQYRASETESIAAMDNLIEWLPQNLPHDDGKVSLIHGDFRIDNIIFDAQRSRARALLDWELSTLGHAYADLAYQCMQWRMPRDCVIPGFGDSDRVALGIPSEADYVARYCARRGLDAIPDWNFYLVFGFFRFAAILQGVQKRALDGNASSSKAFEYGAMAPVLAQQALELIE
ncbi:MAG: phosphotransferase [Gammaproteobacteria bacterium]|nr:phosphotransferase [Gammaproteobacteria bacterium]